MRGRRVPICDRMRVDTQRESGRACKGRGGGDPGSCHAGGPRADRPPAQPKSTVQMVVLEQVPASDTASGQVDILKDAKKPCSSVADDADKFKK